MVAYLLEGSSGHDLQERGIGTSRFQWRKCHDATFFCAPSHQPEKRGQSGRVANSGCSIQLVDIACLPKATTLLQHQLEEGYGESGFLMDFTAVSARPLLRGSSPGFSCEMDTPLTAPLFWSALGIHVLDHYVYVPHDTHQLAITRLCPWWHMWPLWLSLKNIGAARRKNSGFKLCSFFALTLVFFSSPSSSIFSFFFYLTLWGPFFFYGFFFFFLVEDSLDCRFRFLILNWYRSFFIFLCFNFWSPFFKFSNLFLLSALNLLAQSQVRAPTRM